MMMARRIGVSAVLIVALMLLVAACGPSGPASRPEDDTATVDRFTKNADGYADVTVEQLAGLMEDKDMTLVNVHIPYEGEIPETDLFIPFDAISEHLDELPDKDAPIVLYCRSGSMSTTAAQELAALGYSNVFEVDGGFRAWEAKGYELLHTR